MQTLVLRPLLRPPSREFVIGSYVDIKKANPGLPILIREAEGTEAKLTARYGEGGVEARRRVRTCCPPVMAGTTAQAGPRLAPLLLLLLLPPQIMAWRRACRSRG